MLKCAKFRAKFLIKCDNGTLYPAPNRLKRGIRLSIFHLYPPALRPLRKAYSYYTAR